jgi:RNA polymerase sigma-70 factor, ECF subfamily
MTKLVQCETFEDSELLESKDLPEAEAIRRAQEGDATAFERLYRLHSGRVYAVCLTMMKGNAAEAEDLTQEAFMQLFRKIGTFRAESAFSTWLYRLTFNTVLMRLRKRTIATENSLEEIDDAGEEARGPIREIGGPDLRLSGLADRLNLQRAMSQLSPGYRSIFLLHDISGYEHKEIANMLGCSVGNSKSQLHKARAVLRDLLLEGKRNDRRRKHKRPDERYQPMCELPYADPLLCA